MIATNEIRNRLYDKYIAPTKKDRDSYIGIEIELPIVNLNKEAVDFDLVFKTTDRFLQEFGFEVTGRDDDKHIYAARHPENGDILSYDCSYNNLELSMGKEKDLHTLKQRFDTYYAFFQKEFGKEHHTLTGMGINPYRKYNHNVPIANERYRMLFHHLASFSKYQDENHPAYFHPYPLYGAFSSASQVQLDVNYDDLIPTIRAFTLLEPIKSLLFSNSILNGEEEDLLCCRDMLWENSTHGINPHNIGMFEEIPSSHDELLDYIQSCSLYCVMRDGKYINFRPTPLDEYFQQNEITGDVYDGKGSYKKITFQPQLSDLEYLRSFKFEDLTFRGTIEFRSCCCQPVSDAMTIAAFHLGLQNKVHELDELFAKDHVLYHHGFTAKELRNAFNRNRIPATIDIDGLYDLVITVLDLASDGLRSRSLGEEIYLNSLYERAKAQTNPAKTMLDRLKQGENLENIILKYGALKRN